MKNFWGAFAKFAVRSPGVAFFFLTFFFLLPGSLLFSYNIMLFHLTLPPRKGMQMQIGPIVFNCMHWRVAAQLKCFKCLCLKHRGSWHLQWGEPVTPGSPRSNKPTPGSTTDRKRTRDGLGVGVRTNSLGQRAGDRDRVRHRHEDNFWTGRGGDKKDWRISAAPELR